MKKYHIYLDQLNFFSVLQEDFPGHLKLARLALVDDQNASSFSVCKLALDASFQQIDRKHNCLHFTFLRGKYLFLPLKNTNDI